MSGKIWNNNTHILHRLLYPLGTKLRGVHRNHFICLSVRLSFCPSVCADLCQAHNFFLVWHWLTIFGTCVYHYETMCRAQLWSQYDFNLWPQGKIYRVFDMFSCLDHNFFWFDNGLLYLAHPCITMRHSWSQYHVDLWPQGKITWLITFWGVDIAIPYFAHGSIIMRGCVTYIHNPDLTLTFDLKVKFLGFCRVFTPDP